jgi:hypothetical protein
MSKTRYNFNLNSYYTPTFSCTNTANAIQHPAKVRIGGRKIAIEAGNAQSPHQVLNHQRQEEGVESLAGKT